MLASSQRTKEWSMDLLIETWRDTAVREGFVMRRPLPEISAETGLSVREVLEREIQLLLIPADEATALLSMLSPGSEATRPK
jgi:hypothetical protein